MNKLLGNYKWNNCIKCGERYTTTPGNNQGCPFCEEKEKRKYTGNFLTTIKYLFRGKKKDESNKWVIGHFLPKSSSDPKIVQPEIRPYSEYKEYSIIPETLGLFTNRSDKNGTRIFEGDIIELPNEKGEMVRVVCCFGPAERDINGNMVDIMGFHYVNLHDSFKSFPITENYQGKTDYELFEIIGNLHDNPELLNE